MACRSGVHRFDGCGGFRADPALVGVVAPLAVLHTTWLQLAGIVIAAAGIVATVYAELDMGDSWRIGVDRSETTTLVRSGVFGWVRNPIFTAMLVFGSESPW